MYRLVLAELARDHGWQFHLFEARGDEGPAVRILGSRPTSVAGRRWPSASTTSELAPFAALATT